MEIYTHVERFSFMMLRIFAFQGIAQSCFEAIYTKENKKLPKQRRAHKRPTFKDQSKPLALICTDKFPKVV